MLYTPRFEHADWPVCYRVLIVCECTLYECMYVFVCSNFACVRMHVHVRVCVCVCVCMSVGTCVIRMLMSVRLTPLAPSLTGRRGLRARDTWQRGVL